MKRVVKVVLRWLGLVPGFRFAWLRTARWFLSNWKVPARWRDFVMWELGTYVLGEDYRANVRMQSGPVLSVGMEDELNRLALFCSGRNDYLWEPQTLRLALHLQVANSVTLIAGAHIGYHALHLAQHMQTMGGQVVAFEPAGAFYGRLVSGKKLSGYENLICEHAALGKESCSEVVLYLAGVRSSVDSSLASKTGETEVVPLVALDDYVREHRLKNVGMIFLDIEGNELDALLGARTLVEHKPNLILEVNRPGLRSMNQTPDELYELLFAERYSVFYIEDDYFFTLGGYDPERVILRPIYSEDESFRPDMRAFNILAVQRLDVLQQEWITILSDRAIRRQGKK